ncbi:MAG: hypothetical protein JXR78_09550, partial [Victivallales bacterium]|nr:hypothetical protein [Victivallales bacterium]
FRMEEPNIPGAVLDKDHLHRCDSVEFYMEALAHSPYFVRYILTMDGRQTSFGNKKLETAIHKGENFWNLEFFVPFTPVLSWTHPAPAAWQDNSDIRFNVVRHRMNKDANGRVINEKSRWNPSTLNSPFDMRGFGKLLLEPIDKR